MRLLSQAWWESTSGQQRNRLSRTYRRLSEQVSALDRTKRYERYQKSIAAKLGKGVADHGVSDEKRAEIDRELK